MKRLLMIMGLAIPIMAQSPPTTVFMKHALGETVQQWITSQPLDMQELCAPKGRKQNGQHVIVSLFREKWVSSCDIINGILSGSNDGSILTPDPDPEIRDKYYTPSIKWSFETGKLAKVSLEKSLLYTTAEEQIDFLSKIYGAPKFDTIAYRNAMGGVWDTIHAVWNLPDGAQIDATEIIHNNGNKPPFSAPGTLRSLVVNVSSADYIHNQITKQTQKPNPYAN